MGTRRDQGWTLADIQCPDPAARPAGVEARILPPPCARCEARFEPSSIQRIDLKPGGGARIVLRWLE